MGDLVTEVVGFVARSVGCDEAGLEGDVRLFHDLGIDGDDGRELLEAFARRFRVDLTGLEIERCFGPEAAATPLSLVRGLIRAILHRPDTTMEPLRIDDLVLAARTGRWPEKRVDIVGESSEGT